MRAVLKHAAEGEGLTPVQAQTLRFAARTKSFMASVGNLAAALGVTHVTAVKVVSGLERRGLLERTPSEWDGRVSLLRLTASGTDVAARLATWQQTLDRSLALLTPAERAALEPTLGAVVRSLQAASLLTVAEPCRGCVYFEEHANPQAREPHRCRLIERFISERESLLECPDHKAAA